MSNKTMYITNNYIRDGEFLDMINPFSWAE